MWNRTTKIYGTIQSLSRHNAGFRNQIRNINNIIKEPPYKYKYPRDPRQPKNLEEFKEDCTQLCNIRIFPPTYYPINFMAMRIKPMELYKIKWPKPL